MIDFFLSLFPEDKGNRDFLVWMLFHGLLCLSLIYLIIAFFLNRKDRKALEKLAVEKGLSIRFKSSFWGVDLEIHQPTDRSGVTPSPTQMGRKSHPRPRPFCKGIPPVKRMEEKEWNFHFDSSPGTVRSPSSCSTIHSSLISCGLFRSCPHSDSIPGSNPSTHSGGLVDSNCTVEIPINAITGFLKGLTLTSQ